MKHRTFDYISWLLFALLYSPILYQLYNGRWEGIDYTHAYFILPISLWLVWRKRKELVSVARKDESGAAGFVLIALGVLMLWLGWRNDYLVVSTLSLIPALFGMAAYLYGKGVSKALSFPVLYLLLAVPPPLGVLDSVTIPMRYGASIVVEHILRFFHYPISRQGLLLLLGDHEILMGAPCSGFRSLITMFSLGLVYVYIGKSPKIERAVLVTSIVPLALIGNVIRVIAICLITFYFGDKAGQGFLHYFSGMVVFIIMIIGLIGIERLMEKRRAA